jgi:hypothetical protein
MPEALIASMVAINGVGTSFLGRISGSGAVEE